ncbi:LysR family transcriptional regulator, partial [Acetobacter pasteurianus]
MGIAGGRIPLITLLQLLSVAEHLNFRQAASALGVTQSSVSARIKALEETLGISLFERRHRGVRLTEAGQRFVVEVAAGIEQLDHAVQTAGFVARARPLYSGSYPAAVKKLAHSSGVKA